jgi:hypothetical protein
MLLFDFSFENLKQKNNIKHLDCKNYIILKKESIIQVIEIKMNNQNQKFNLLL